MVFNKLVQVSGWVVLFGSVTHRRERAPVQPVALDLLIFCVNFVFAVFQKLFIARVKVFLIKVFEVLKIFEFVICHETTCSRIIIHNFYQVSIGLMKVFGV